MPTPAIAVGTINAAILAGWDDGTYPISWPAAHFEPPAGAWLKVDYLWGAGAVITKNGRNAIIGVLQLAVFGPRDTGDGAILALAETARGIFNRVRTGDILFTAASGPVLRLEESWRQAIISVPFTVQEVV